MFFYKYIFKETPKSIIMKKRFWKTTKKKEKKKEIIPSNKPAKILIVHVSPPYKVLQSCSFTHAPTYTYPDTHAYFLSSTMVRR